jgi:hypothetical protein
MTTLRRGRLINPRDRLQSAKPSAKSALRVNRDSGAQSGLALKPTSEVAPEAVDKPETSSVHVNDKMKLLAQGFFTSGPAGDKPASSKPSAAAATAREQPKQPSAAPATAREQPKQPSTAREQQPKLPSVSPAVPTVSSSAALMKRHSLTDSLSSSPNCSIPSPSLSRKSSIGSYATPPTSRKSSAEPASVRGRGSLLFDTADVKEPPAARPCLIKDSLDEISGVNQNLCSLAQSYFQQQKPAAAMVRRKSSLGPEAIQRKSSLGPEPTAAASAVLARNASFKTDARRLASTQPEELPVLPQNLALKMEDDKASLVAAFFQGARPPPPVKVSYIICHKKHR